MKTLIKKAATAQRKTTAQNELVDTIAEEVSSVDHPAINEPFYLIKAAAPAKDDPKAKDKKKPAGFMGKADPPAEGAPADQAAAPEGSGATMSNADAYKVLGAYMEGLVAVANEIQASGDMEAPVAPQVIDALGQATTEFEKILGIAEPTEVEAADDTNEEQEVEASAPAQTKEAPVPSPQQKRTFKLTGDKLVRFDVAMELLNQIGAVSIDAGGEEETTEEAAPAPAPAKGKAPAAAAPAKAPAAEKTTAKKNETGEEVPAWARVMVKTQQVLANEIKALKTGKPAGSVNKNAPRPASQPVDTDADAGDANGVVSWPKDFGRSRDELRGRGR